MALKQNKQRMRNAFLTASAGWGQAKNRVSRAVNLSRLHKAWRLGLAFFFIVQKIKAFNLFMKGRTMDISRKINVLFAAGLIAMAVMAWWLSSHFLMQAKNSEIKTIHELLLNERQKQAENLVNNAFCVIETADFYETARNALREMRYGPKTLNLEASKGSEGDGGAKAKGSDYFFVVDVDGMFWVNPMHPELEETVALDLKDASGREYIKEIIETAKNSEDGAGDLMYTEAVEGSDRVQTKKGFFKLYEDWGWILCTGVPVDDIDVIAAGIDSNVAASFSGKKRSLVIYMALMGLLIIVLSRTLVWWKIVKPIKRATAMMREIAQGEADLTRRLKVESRDEIGQWAMSFNTFVENTQAMIREIMAHARNLQNASGEMRVVSDSLAAGTDQTSTETHWVTNSVNDMNVNLGDAAASLNETAHTVRQIAAASNKMNKSLAAIEKKTEDAMEVTKKAVVQAVDASEKILHLGRMAAFIGEVNEAIAEVTDQVNMLSINAAIEAAKAGDAGKGFQVVAREMKALSAQTAEASANIRSQIRQIQDTSHLAIDEVENITMVIKGIDGFVEEIVRATREQAGHTSNITRDIQETSRALDRVNDNVSSCSDSTRLIVRKISEVNTTAGDMAQGNQNLIANASMLTSMADQLQNMVFRFKITDERPPARAIMH
jgi:methyl-accepting chemotaxis protein